MVRLIDDNDGEHRKDKNNRDDYEVENLLLYAADCYVFYFFHALFSLMKTGNGYCARKELYERCATVGTFFILS